MSMDQLTAFGRKCTLDPMARARLQQIHLENLDSLIAFANELGFAISKADFEELGGESRKSGELSDEQLATIAGGVGSEHGPFGTAGAAMAALFASLGVDLR